jgi:hypothetical protein
MHAADMTTNRPAFDQRQRVALTHNINMKERSTHLCSALKGGDDGGRKVLPQRLMQRLSQAGCKAALQHRRQLATTCKTDSARVAEVIPT